MTSVYSGKNGRNSAIWGAEQLANSRDAAQNALTEGYGKATTNFGKQGDLWAGVAADQPKYQQMFGNALGVNGQSGSDAARSAFQSSPGYGYQMNQGLDALDRRAASRGMLASGNNSLDTLNYSQGLANQDWSNWLNNLSKGQTTGLMGIQGQSQALGNQANTDYRYGGDQGSIWAQYNPQIVSQGQSGFKAGDTAAANINSAQMGVAKMGVDALGMMMGVPPGTLSKMVPSGGGQQSSGGGNFMQSLMNGFGGGGSGSPFNMSTGSLY